MTRYRDLAPLVFIALLCISTAFGPAAWGQGASPANSGYSNSSWALGVVVPEGAALQGGGKVRWESVTNVTTEVSLPNITLTDRNIYAVMSVMTSDGSVLQVATGALPNRSVWLSFAWFVPSTGSTHLTYDWILNASGPQMAPESNVTVSIFFASGSWNLGVKDSDTGQAVVRRFPLGISSSLRPGDQEVFALESYSSAESTFQNMGNLTMDALLLNGERVVSGFYTYGQWDPNHNPLFSVGSAAGSPPSFIYVGQGAEGSYFWDYAGTWKVTGGSIFGLAKVMTVALAVSGLALLGAAAWLKVARRNPRTVAVGGQAVAGGPGCLLNT